MSHFCKSRAKPNPKSALIQGNHKTRRQILRHRETFSFDFRICIADPIAAVSRLLSDILGVAFQGGTKWLSWEFLQMGLRDFREAGTYRGAQVAVEKR
jgi:hypothetical protein